MPNNKLEEEFPGNSKSSRTAPIRTDKGVKAKKNKTVVAPIPDKKDAIKNAVKGHGIVKKKTFAQSIAKTFLGEDTKGVVNYILFDVLVPAAKNTIQEMFSSGIEMLLFGETRSSSRSRSRDRDRTVVSYGNFYRHRDDDDHKESRRPTSRAGRFDLDDIVFRHGDEASEVLDGLCDLLDQYEQVTVADYFELAGIDGASWAHEKWGWENLSKAYCTHTRGGYAIVLPKPIELD